MLTEVLKDYIVHAEDLINLHGSGWFTTIKAVFSYGFHSLALAFVYIVTLQWITDFMAIPAVFKHHTMLIMDGKNVLYSTLNVDLESGFEATPLNNKGLITGLMNSFFLAAPVGVPQLLWLRHLLVISRKRAIWAAAGVVAAHGLFLGFVLFGWEWVLIPWFYLEPVTIWLGLILLFRCVGDMVVRPHLYILWRGGVEVGPDRHPLWPSFRQTFVLTWFETLSIYQHFGNLSVHGGLMETSLGTKFYLLSTVAYWLGLVLGSILCSFFWGWLFLTFRKFGFRIAVWAGLDGTEPTPVKMHYGLVLAICMMGLHTFPYYGLDYLATGPLGFLYQDRALHSVQPRTGHNISERFLDKDYEWDFAVDSTSFDDDYTVTEEGVYEQTTFAAEPSWQNRENIRHRLVDKDSQRFSGYYWQFFDPFGYRTPVYQTPELNVIGIPDPDDPSLTTLLEDLQDTMFVEENYFGLSDADSRDEDAYVYEMESQRRFRDRYYSNPIYKKLMQADMLNFLAGQPSTSNLFPEDEFDLYQRRFILQRYLDFVSNFKTGGRKPEHSFATQVYNQQFKGTMTVIRQFNAVRVIFPDLDANGNRESLPHTKELKFDQPLYNRYHDEYKDWLHEELRPDIPEALWQGLQDPGRTSENKLKNDLNLELPAPQKQKLSGAKRKLRRPWNKALDGSKTESANGINPKLARQLRYMTLNMPGPFYIGWDAQLHKMVLKGSQLPNTLTPGNEVSIPLSDNTALAKDKHVTFKFKAWPTWPKDPERAWLQQLHLPNLMVTNEQMQELRHIFDDLTLTFTKEANDDHPETQHVDLGQDKDFDTFFSLITNFDWNDRISDLFLEEDGGPLAAYLQLGHVLPPQMDGVAWPSSGGNKQIQKDPNFNSPGYPEDWVP